MQAMCLRLCELTPYGSKTKEGKDMLRNDTIKFENIDSIEFVQFTECNNSAFLACSGTLRAGIKPFAEMQLANSAYGPAKLRKWHFNPRLTGVLP